MTLTREQVIEMAKAAGLPDYVAAHPAFKDAMKKAFLAGRDSVISKIRIPTETMEQEYQFHYRQGFSAGRDAGLGEAAPLLQRSINHIQQWWATYGEHLPDWLPPAGGVELIEDINALKGSK